MDEGNSSAPGPWHTVPIEEYTLPPDGRTNLVKKRWKALRQRFSGEDGEAEVFRAEADLRELPNVRLAHIVPPIDWSSAARSLAQAFSEVTQGGILKPGARSSKSEDTSPWFFVCPPYCDHSLILENWAAEHQARVWQPPGTKQILNGDSAWLETLPKGNGQPWVLPALERCFFRHANGLDLLRGFMERALSGEWGPGIIGCDSWAFAFVQRIFPLTGAPAMTLQAFDGPMLADYFVRGRTTPGSRNQIRFFSARSGEPLVPDETQDAYASTGAPSGDEQDLPEFRQLAAHCQGNPGLAWHYWRKQLRSEPETEQQDRAEVRETGGTTQNTDGPGSSDNVWVAQDVETPPMPAEADEDVAFVLHAILLHRGLTTNLLTLLLPSPRARIASQLLRLQALGLLTRDGERWQVAPLAYSTVREFLRVRRYLTDAF